MLPRTITILAKQRNIVKQKKSHLNLIKHDANLK